MENPVECFSLVRIDKPSAIGACYALCYNGKETRLEGGYESVIHQHLMQGSNLYFVALENDPLGKTNYQFYLVNGNGVVLDCLDFPQRPGQDLCGMENGRLEGNTFKFSKDDKNYEVSIDGQGSVRYTAKDFKYRSLDYFMRPKKFLSLSMQ